MPTKFSTETSRTYERSEDPSVQLTGSVQDKGDRTSDYIAYPTEKAQVDMHALYDQVLDLRLELTDLKRELGDVKQQLGDVRDEQSELSRQMDTVATERARTVEAAISVRDISDCDAESLILALFSKSEEPLVYSEMAAELKLSLDQVVRLCDKLMAEGRIEYDDE